MKYKKKSNVNSNNITCTLKNMLNIFTASINLLFMRKNKYVSL